MGKLSLAILAVTLVATFVNGDEKLIIGGREYFIADSKAVTWFAASERCRVANMQLISFETEEKWNLIRDTLMAIPEYEVLNFWTSGARVDGTWMWTGRAHEIKFFAWGPTEPTDGENCLEMHGFAFEKWHSLGCNVPWSHYICEYPVCCDLGPPASPDPLHNL